MSKTVDFIQSNLANFTKILRPELPNKQERQPDKKGLSSIKITKSFIPEKKSSISEALRPEIDQLKQFYKKKMDEEKRMKALLAEGKITREELAQDKAGKRPEKEKEKEEEKEKVRVDESGQVRDQQGNLLFVRNRTTDLLINKKKDEQIQLKSLAKKQRIKFHQKLSRSILDRNLIVGTSKRRLRRSTLGLQFLEKGSYQPAESRREVKNEIENLQDVFAEKPQEEQVRIIKKRTIVNLKFTQEIPEVEWWDAPLLKGSNYSQLLAIDQNSSLQTALAALAQADLASMVDWNTISGECYFQKVGVSSGDERIVLPMYPTKDERKKMKRKRKHQKLLEKNDKIKLGLIEPDKPKLRVGNMAIVYKNEFVLDPSKIEAEAKKQTEERINKHLQTNSSRKLTKAQKKDKVMRKLKRDSAKQCRRIVFKIRKLTDPSLLFKVDINAKQLHLNGFVIKPSGEIPNHPTMVLVEGGAKAVGNYRKLMLYRIRWSGIDPTNSCQLLWQGEIENSTVGKWRVHEVGDEVQAIRLLTEKKMQNYWEYISMD